METRPIETRLINGQIIIVNGLQRCPNEIIERLVDGNEV